MLVFSSLVYNSFYQHLGTTSHLDVWDQWFNVISLAMYLGVYKLTHDSDEGTGVDNILGHRDDVNCTEIHIKLTTISLARPINDYNRFIRLEGGHSDF